MKFISPHVEWWPQTNYKSHIARVGRICYKSAGKQPPAELTGQAREDFLYQRDRDMCSALWNAGHRSMFRHGTLYFHVPSKKEFPRTLWSIVKHSPYVGCTVQHGHVFVSINLQFAGEHGDVRDLLAPFQVTEQEFISHATGYGCRSALELLRMTLVVTTQRIQGESYNRKSPNCIAEQSTRYVNLDKKGGVLICRPHWERNARWYQRWASHLGYWVAEKVYQFLLRTGLKPEDARGNLTMNTYTVCAYTYTLREWRHIMDMRLRDLTGRAHPDAHIVAEQISRIINDRMRPYVADYEI